MPIKIITVKGNSELLEKHIIISDSKKSLIKSYIEQNKAIDGIEEATGIKFVKPVKKPNG